MSLLDKVIASVTPPETDEARVEARQKARDAAEPGSWLALVLDHHLQIEAGFAAVIKATNPTNRRLAQKQLAVILNGHSLAEEVVLYPALSKAGEKTHMTAGYTEQSATKVQMALLEDLEPMSQDYVDKLEHIRGAVEHHVYEEEGNCSWTSRPMPPRTCSPSYSSLPRGIPSLHGWRCRTGRYTAAG